MLDVMLTVTIERMRQVAKEIPLAVDDMLDADYPTDDGSAPLAENKMNLLDDRVAEIQRLAVIYDYLNAQYKAVEEIPDEAPAKQGFSEPSKIDSGSNSQDTES
ncbi:hypothetical protein L248_1654 [Schleiferilactobacillus shenzhenensis LY-73]|uniref:Uncharacterized protein n=2 Tax=Schleiferilactobacillus shenzhenensis TaxID=1231337 RepID=U4TR70_9LACO|nr:hypothetical protein L248_1654 [Schleiferilactobacillus shenzhenensis LY-73]